MPVRSSGGHATVAGDRGTTRPSVGQLRDSVRGWDAFYVPLAEALNATLVNLDGRLTRAHGPKCQIEVLGAPAA
jgi:hypothetical protein